MRISIAVATATALFMPGAAFAQAVSGLYIAAGAGGNFMQSADLSYTSRESAFVQTFGNQTFSNPATTFVDRGSIAYDPGAVGVGSVGYGFGNGLRVELEGNYRYNARSNAVYQSEQKGGAMVNALYDFNVGSPDIFPYVGLGAGYNWTNRGYSLGRTNAFAYQAIFGVATPLPWIRGLSATLEYRFMGLAESQQSATFPATQFSGTTVDTIKYTGDYNHSILVGLRYAFNTPAPPPPADAPATAPMPTLPSRTYLVFFDWDRLDLSDRARQIVAEAAQNTSRVQFTRIEVQGNADSSGTPAYNQRLSLRRAQTVAAELVRDGVASTAIDIQAFGDTRPLVPTATGVREPQNRRVAIILK